jgi:transcriptional regulator with XRE-family HTH domain
MELKTARRIARLTQLQLAKRAGVDDSFISLLERGKRRLPEGYFAMVRIARALNVEPEELFPVPPLDVPVEDVKGAA